MCTMRIVRLRLNASERAGTDTTAGRRGGFRPASHHWGVGKNPNFVIKRYGSGPNIVAVAALHVPLPNSPGRTVHGMSRDKKTAERAAAEAACDVLDGAGLLRKGGRLAGTSTGEEWVLPSARLAVDMHLLSQCEAAAHELLEEAPQLSAQCDDSRSRASPLPLTPRAHPLLVTCLFYSMSFNGAA